MELSLLHLSGSVIASAAAIGAIAADRFSNLPASIFAISGGLTPWIFIAKEAISPVPYQIDDLYAFIISGLIFLFARTVYIARQSPNHRIAAGTCSVGMINGIAFIFFTYASMMSGFR